MQVSHRRQESRHLGRTMEYRVYGHTGWPVVVFPTSQGRFFQYEDSGMVKALERFIESGQIQLWTVDGIDSETFFADHGDLGARIGRHEAYFRHVREEILPEVAQTSRAANGGREMKPLVTGCSMGGFHSANFLFRFPDAVAGVIALSGVYSTRHFFGPALDGQIYFNSPLDYLPGLADEALLGRLRQCHLVFCCGQGAWEDDMLEDTRRLEGILRDKGIPAWVDYWGGDVNHDWPWWHKQMPYFLDKWLDAAHRPVAAAS